MRGDSQALADLIRAATGLLARDPKRRSAEETGLALTALGLAERVLAAGPVEPVSVRVDGVDTRADVGKPEAGAAAALHERLEARARQRLAQVNPRYLESLAAEEAGGRS